MAQRPLSEADLLLAVLPYRDSLTLPGKRLLATAAKAQLPVNDLNVTKCPVFSDEKCLVAIADQRKQFTFADFNRLE
jgi:hypothetical protein